MAALHENPGRQTMEDVLAARLRGFRAQALALLPGAVALFGFQVLGLLRPARASLASLPHFALLSSALWTAASVLLLSIVLSHRPAIRISEGAQQIIRAFGWTLAFALGGLLVGVASDVFAALDIVTGSWALAVAAAGALVALAGWIWW